MRIFEESELFANSELQVEILQPNERWTSFEDKIREIGLHPFQSTGIEVLQINVGKVCNQACRHCHVNAGPDRKESMSAETFKLCLNVLRINPIPVVDITGGAPELNPNLKWFIHEAHELGKHIILRCNLTSLQDDKFVDLPYFLAELKVEIVGSLPYFSGDETDRQRGEGVFNKSVATLQKLNQIGYGKENTGLLLNLVYNPNGAFLPASQTAMEKRFKLELSKQFGIEFNSLFTITNMPISRFLSFLLRHDIYESYMQKMVSAFNPAAARNVMCRYTLSVGWDGYLYDCDFNQMLELNISQHLPQHVRDFDWQKLNIRDIILNSHCYGCTAGAGSSCGGAVLD